MQQCLHLPLAVNAAGKKLSQQTYAAHIKTDNMVLFDVLNFLGQAVPAELEHASCETIWQRAMTNWKRESIPKNNQLPAAGYFISGEPVVTTK